MIDDPLDELDDAEIALIVEMRDRQADQRHLRARVLTDLGERVEVRCRVHLLDPESEMLLVGRLRELDDRLAVIRHVAADAAGHPESREDAERTRETLATQVDAVVVDLAVAIGRPPRGGDDWSLDDVPLDAREDIADTWATLRRDLVRVVDHLVGSDLVRVAVPPLRSAAMTDVVLREHDAEAVARVLAFIEEVRRLDALAARCAERVRRIALRAANAQPRNWLAQNQLRNRQAREALDMVRAVHAARAELESIARSG